MVDLSRVSDEQLRAEWARLVQRGQSLTVRTDLAAVEREMLRRCWAAPCAEEPKA